MAYTKVTVATETEVKSDDINQISDNIELAGRFAGADVLKARGLKDATVSSGNASTSVEIDFSTDCEDGDPGFSETPIITVTAEYVSGTFTDLISTYLSASPAPSTSGFEVFIKLSSVPPTDVVLKIHWHAEGK